MTGFFMFLHAMVAILLMVIILMQSGRGGGLTESFASAESMFGAQTNEFMIKATTVFASIFFITCLSIAIFSAQKGKSLMSSNIASETQQSTTQSGDAVNSEGGPIDADEWTTTAVTKDTEIPIDTLPGDVPAGKISESK